MHIKTIKQDVGFYLHRRARTWVNIVSFVPCYPSILNSQLGTPYPRSAGFDTDIGASIESSAVGSQEELMAHLIISDEVRNGDSFTPG